MHERIVLAPISDDPAVVGRTIERARQRGFANFLLPSNSPIELRPSETLIRRHGDELKLGATPEGVPVRTPADLAELEGWIARTPDGAILAVAWPNDRVIPLEWAVAQRGRRFRLWTFARSPDEVPAALGALEHGADRVIVEVRGPEEVDRVEGVLDRPSDRPLEWASVPLTTVRPAGLGDRVIVDTTSLLAPEEGLLVGSAAAFLFHIASEAVGSKFSRPRPFRVNAGAAHSYVLMADGTTRYLSELEPGDAVLVTVPGRKSRSVRVGRIKVERRPLSLVAADDAGKGRTVFLQEAETVRLSSTDGRTALTDLVAGLHVHGVRLPPARHLGTAVEETIDER